MTIIAPSLLSASPMHMARDIEAVETAGADWHHVDVMDGHFVPNLTYGPPFLKSLKQTAKVPLDVHIMVSNPDETAKRFLDAGADCLTFHIEAAKDPQMIISEIKAAGAKAGISLNPDTPVQDIMPWLGSVDLVLVMSVHPGFGGQKFIPNAIDKVKKIREAAGDSLMISVDGGVNEQIAKQVREAGANVLVAGSYVYGNSSMKKAIESLRG